MKPAWFKDSIPLDPLIAPMVLFFQNHGIKTTQSCQGVGKGRMKSGHLYGRPTINFEASSTQFIKRVANLLRKHELDNGMQVGLMTGFFADKSATKNKPWYGQAQWIWTDEGDDYYKLEVYSRVIHLVDMTEIQSITRDHNEWVRAGRPELR